MEEQNKIIEEPEIIEPTTPPAVSVDDDLTDPERKSFVKLVRGILSGKHEEPEEDKESEQAPEPPAKADTITLSAEELEALIEEKASETVTKIAAKTKKKTEHKVKLEAALEKVDNEFKDLIETKLSNEPNFDVDAYLEEHPTFKVKKSNSVVSETGTMQVSTSMSSYLDFYDRKRR